MIGRGFLRFVIGLELCDHLTEAKHPALCPTSFQRAIAEATGNGQFPRFLAFLGSHVIPRQSVRLAVDTPAERRAYLERIQHEHARIVTGISNQDSGGVRRAMHEHLTRSLERYRKLAEGEKHGRR